MRVSPCGFAARSIEHAKALSKAVTEVTHNHPEGIKGAEATAVSIYLAKTGSSKEEIKEYVNEHYYKMDFTLDEIRPRYRFDVSCQGTVPPALEAFFESESFEDAIRNAVSIGGDSDTIAAITGGVAEAHYGVPKSLRQHALTFLYPDQLEILRAFEEKYGANETEDPEGEEEQNEAEVKLRFDSSLMDDVLNRLGSALRIRNADTHTCVVTVLAGIDEGFFEWIAGFEPEIELLGPEDVKEDYEEYLWKLFNS